MSDMSVVVTGSGFAEALQQLDPKNVDRALINWYDRGTRLVRDEMRARAKRRVAAKVKIITDRYTPPRWARIYSTHPVARLLEGGTGPAGDPAFKHKPKHFPNPDKLAKETGLSAPEAFLVARAIANRGGNKAQPFVKPTFAAVQQPLLRLMEQCVTEALK